MRPEQVQALQPVADALVKLGYDGAPEEVWDAVLRMVWIPELVTDMLAFAALSADQRHTAQPMLQRPLPEGFTVASLIADYAFNGAGAFLMGAALVSHTAETLEMLRIIRENGRGIRTPDGAYAHIRVPAGMPAGASAPPAGEDIVLPATNEDESEAPVAVAAAHRAAFCGRCGTPVAPGTRFCGKCGAPVG
jgi:hypothetical protein